MSSLEEVHSGGEGCKAALVEKYFFLEAEFVTEQQEIPMAFWTQRLKV
jgi:hypothetical protein